MLDVVSAVFVRDIPQRVRVKGEWWRFRIYRMGKNGKEAMFCAECETDGRQISLISGATRYVEGACRHPFTVKNGTPAKGFVTELRRLGFVKWDVHVPDLGQFLPPSGAL